MGILPENPIRPLPQICKARKSTAGKANLCPPQAKIGFPGYCSVKQEILILRLPVEFPSLEGLPGQGEREPSPPPDLPLQGGRILLLKEDFGI